MEIHELVIEMKQLERRMTLYEEKYGILSKDVRTTAIRHREPPASGRLRLRTHAAANRLLSAAPATRRSAPPCCLAPLLAY
jgi:hypothetical protein